MLIALCYTSDQWLYIYIYFLMQSIKSVKIFPDKYTWFSEHIFVYRTWETWDKNIFEVNRFFVEGDPTKKL